VLLSTRVNYGKEREIIIRISFFKRKTFSNKEIHSVFQKLIDFFFLKCEAE